MSPVNQMPSRGIGRQRVLHNKQNSTKIKYASAPTQKYAGGQPSPGVSGGRREEQGSSGSEPNEQLCSLTCDCPSLPACLTAHKPALQLQQAVERATVGGAELIREGGDDHVNLLRQAFERQPVQAPATVAVVQLCVGDNEGLQR